MTYDQWKTESGYAEKTPEQENEGRDCPICNGDCAGANPPVYNCPMQPPAGETIRATQDGSMEAAPETGQSPVGAVSTTNAMREALEAIDSEILLPGHLKELVDNALAAQPSDALKLVLALGLGAVQS